MPSISTKVSVYDVMAGGYHRRMVKCCNCWTTIPESELGKNMCQASANLWVAALPQLFTLFSVKRMQVKQMHSLKVLLMASTSTSPVYHLSERLIKIRASHRIRVAEAERVALARHGTPIAKIVRFISFRGARAEQPANCCPQLLIGGSGLMASGKKTDLVTIRLSREDKRMVTRSAAALRMSVSEFSRRGGLCAAKSAGDELASAGRGEKPPRTC